jgi:hypothetical protein
MGSGGGGAATEGALEDGGGGGGGGPAGGGAWDQFAANKALFGVTADFPEGDYTSSPKFTPEQVAAADAEAAALRAEGVAEGGVEGGGGGASEEARFSAVAGPRCGASVPFSDAAVGAKKKGAPRKK